jgi:uncharacterized membrane protein
MMLPPNPLERDADPLVLRRLARDGHLSAHQLDQALARLRAARGETWHAFADKVVLAVAVALVVAGAVFFFAANWEGMSRLARVGLALLAHVVAAAAAVGLGTERTAGRAAAAAAALLIGPVLLVYGQTYQTGADAWQLFAGWAALALPFALLVRGTALWMVVLVLARVGALLWVNQVHGHMALPAMVAAIVVVDAFAALAARKSAQLETGITLVSLVTLSIPLIDATERLRRLAYEVLRGDLVADELHSFFFSPAGVLVVVGTVVLYASLLRAVRARHLLHTTLFGATVAAQIAFFSFGPLKGLGTSMQFALEGALLLVEGGLLAALLTHVLRMKNATTGGDHAVA